MENFDLERPTISTSVRVVRKLRLFATRSRLGDGVLDCELCGVHTATDLHEILNRVHYSPEQMVAIPDVLLSCLCNDCNVNKADTRSARERLLRKNLDRYGFKEGATAIEIFSKSLDRRQFDSTVKFREML